MKYLFALFISILPITLIFSQTQEQEIKNAYQQFNEASPQEKLYLHTDRTFYKPGEMVWFKAYLRDAENLASKVSPIVYVEFINPKGNVERKITLAKKDGIFNGEFLVNQSAPGGLYKIRAYTNWLKNLGEENYFFEKEITVQAVVLPKLLMKLDFEKEAYGSSDQVETKLNVRSLDDLPLANKSFIATISLAGEKIKDVKARTNSDGIANIIFELPNNLKTNDGLINVKLPYEGSTESISRSIPIVLNNIDIQFMAEGGDLIYGTENKLAFKALDEFGKAADISGKLIDNSGKEIIFFESFHKGMGAFIFTPEKGKNYSVKITNPSKITKPYNLPKILENALGLRVLQQEKDKLNLSIYSPIAQTVQVVGHLGGKLERVFYLEVNKGENKLIIPTDNMAVGILKLTLFDQNLKSHAERLVFVNKDRKINVNITTDKNKYLPREDVQLKIEVTDELGKGVEGDFSLAVVDDQIHTFADDKQDNILSYLLMTSELKGTVDEPNFYFDEKEEKADQAIDYVMLTHGWSRFEWRDILSYSKNDIAKLNQFKADELQVIGRLLIDGKPLSNARVWANDHDQFTKTDKDGYFAFSDVSVPLKVNTRHRGLKASQIIYQYATRHAIESEKKQKVFADRDEFLELNEDLAAVMAEDEEAEMEEVENEPIAAADNLRQMVEQPKRERKEKKKALEDQFMNGDFIQDDELSGEVLMLNEVVVRIPAANKEIEANALMAGVQRQQAIPAAPNDAGYFFATGKSFATPNLYIQQVYGNNIFHQSRQFYAPRYNQHSRKQINGNDQRKTLYWNPNVKTDKNGKAEMIYSNADISSTYRIILEGISNNGIVIRNESTYFTQTAVTIDSKTPVAVTHGDTLMIPISIKNNMDSKLSGHVATNNLAGMISLDKTLRRPINIPANKSHTEYFKMVVDKNMEGIKNYYFTFQHSEGTETIYKQIEINPKGFPRSVSLSSKELQRTFTFNINDVLDNSLEGQLNIYPNIMEELLSGTESIIREPYGCFEQTSSSNYPNIMVLKYLKSKGEVNPDIEKKAIGFLKRGYARLTGYECSNGGFEWWGKDPAHETLTAYGLLQFNDMKKVYNGVDEDMIQRTQDWLLNKRDGKGGYKQRGGGLDRFTGSSYEVGNAYISYALTQSGYKDLNKEVAFSTEEALKSKDAYRLALCALSNFNIGNKINAKKCLDVLKEQFKLFDETKIQVNETVTRSYGNHRITESASLFAMGLMREDKTDMELLDKLIIMISGKRSGHGGFGSTQSTVLALQAFTDYAQIMGKTEKSGKIQVFANGTKIHELKYNAGHRGKINVDLKPYLKPGENKITVAFDETDEALPYSANIAWTSLTPDSSPNCRVNLETTLSNKNVKVGETVRLTAKVKNIYKDNVPTPIALIGIPAGLSLQPWQLKEMTEKETMDYYEIKGNYLIAYFTEIGKGKERILNLDLKADIPGSYKSPASTAYLYYDKQDKDWEKGTEVIINNE